MAKSSSELNRYNKFIGSLFDASWSIYDPKEKSRAAFQHILYMLSRTQSMFKYNGLPDTITKRNLELILQLHGSATFYEHNGQLYAFRAGLGGEPNEYYMPTIATIANPALRLDINAKIGEECIVVPNDSLYVGLLPLFNRYATFMTENELSINRAIINTRLIDIITAPDDNAKRSAEILFEKIEEGSNSIVSDYNIMESIRSLPYSTQSNKSLTELIELEQYLKASWYNEIGLNANYNMKRESINAGESQLNNDALLPLVDDMLECRQEGIDKINKKFGTNIKVALASSWEDNEEEIAMEHENLKEIDANREGGKNET